MKKTKNAKPKPAPEPPVVSSPQPTIEEIAAKAYAIWEQEGRPAGRDMEFWLRAEVELRA